MSSRDSRGTRVAIVMQVLQFGYVSMFVVVFPLAPFFAVANNIWEFKLDLGMLGKTRRPQVCCQ